MRRKHDGTPLPIEFQKARVIVAVPATDMCHTRFATSLCGLIAYSMKEAPGLGVSCVTYGTSILPWSRQLLVYRARKLGASHMLWLDSDMVFPSDTLIRFVRHQKDIVAANCMVRRAPFRCTAQVGGKELITSPESSGLEKADRLGLACALVSMEVFERVPEPWFELQWLPEEHLFRGEDYGFCLKVLEAGFEMYIDHDLSKQVEHLALFGLNPTHRTPETPAYVGDIEGD